MWSAGAGWTLELEADGARYRLPPRPIGWMRHFGWIPVGLGVALGFGALSLALRLAWPALERGLPAGDPSESIEEWLRLGAGALTLVIGLSLALRMVGIGAIVVAGHSEIELRGEWLVGIERGGPFRRRRRVRAGEVRSLRVSDALRGASSGASPRGAADGLGPGPWGALARLEAVPASGPTIALATGYPAGVLEALARDLAERVASAAALSGGALGAPPTVERPARAAQSEPLANVGPEGWTGAQREAERDRNADAARAARPPANCPIEVEHTGGGLIVRVPPAGLLRGSYGLFPMGLFWTAVVLLFAAVFVTVESRGGGDGDLGPLGLLALFTLFLAIGIGLLWFGARAGTRRTTIEVSRPLLRVVTVALGRTREETLAVRELQAIKVGPSGIKVNDRDVLELQLHRQDGGHRGLLRGRRSDELEWLAALLRAELALPAAPGPRPAGSA